MWVTVHTHIWSPLDVHGRRWYNGFMNKTVYYKVSSIADAGNGIAGQPQYSIAFTVVEKSANGDGTFSPAHGHGPGINFVVSGEEAREYFPGDIYEVVFTKTT